MRSPQTLRNGETPSTISENCFQSTVSLQKLRRFNNLILLFRFAAFCFSIASVAFMGTNSHSDAATWSNFDAFRFILAANSIVAIYSIVEMGASVWEISRGETILPEAVQLWFEFGHDQVFSYLLLAANASAIVLFRRLKEEGKCAEESGFCLQLSISIALGFCGFSFWALLPFFLDFGSSVTSSLVLVFTCRISGRKRRRRKYRNPFYLFVFCQNQLAPRKWILGKQVLPKKRGRTCTQLVMLESPSSLSVVFPKSDFHKLHFLPPNPDSVFSCL